MYLVLPRTTGLTVSRCEGLATRDLQGRGANRRPRSVKRRKHAKEETRRETAGAPNSTRPHQEKKSDSTNKAKQERGVRGEQQQHGPHDHERVHDMHLVQRKHPVQKRLCYGEGSQFVGSGLGIRVGIAQMDHLATGGWAVDGHAEMVLDVARTCAPSITSPPPHISSEPPWGRGKGKSVRGKGKGEG